MKFVELYNTETDQNEFFNMDKVLNVAPEFESGGLFSSGSKEVGSTLFFENGDNTQVKQTAKEVVALAYQQRSSLSTDGVAQST
jgi:hypothetical protein